MLAIEKIFINNKYMSDHLNLNTQVFILIYRDHYYFSDLDSIFAIYFFWLYPKALFAKLQNFYLILLFDFFYRLIAPLEI